LTIITPTIISCKNRNKNLISFKLKLDVLKINSPNN
jgi:hypothetical protein